MNAAEFIAKFGWEKARESISHVAWCETAYCIRLGHGCFKSTSDCCVDINDLKRYVDAWELVQIHGFEQSKEVVKNAPSDEHFYSWSLGNSGVKDKTVNIGELRKAIALVEEVESLKEVGYAK